jgi:DNA-binding Lrp family transcriptional regulator
MNIEEFFGLRVRVVLVLLRNGPMTQTALARELNATAKVLKRHLAWLVENGIVKAYGTLYTIYEPNPNHPITKTLQELLKTQ